MSEGEIQRGVPVPPQRRRRYGPVYELEPGESVLLTNVNYESLRAIISAHQRKHRTRFTARKQPGGSVRVWRLEGSPDDRQKPAAAAVTKGVHANGL